MQIAQLKQQDLSLLLKLFGALFYYQPKDYSQAHLDALIDSVDTQIEPLNQMLISFKQEQYEALQMEHDRLFTGVGDMVAPPWGSVYLDNESVLFGLSTIEYRHFLRRCGFEVQLSHKEPEDQIGLMLMVLGMLIDTDQETSAKELLRVHLMSWFGFYIRRFHLAAELSAYRQLGLLSQQLLEEICTRYDVIPVVQRDCFNAPA